MTVSIAFRRSGLLSVMGAIRPFLPVVRVRYSVCSSMAEFYPTEAAMDKDSNPRRQSVV